MSEPTGSTLKEMLFGNDPEIDRWLEEKYRQLDIGQRIYDLRKQAGLSQAQLARRVGTSPSAISRLEHGNYRGHSVSMLTRIGQACGHRVTILFEPEEEKQAA